MYIQEEHETFEDAKDGYGRLSNAHKSVTCGTLNLQFCHNSGLGEYDECSQKWRAVCENIHCVTLVKNMIITRVLNERKCHLPKGILLLQFTEFKS